MIDTFQSISEKVSIYAWLVGNSILLVPLRLSMFAWLFSSFQFETETEGSKLRRDVLVKGNVGSGGAPTGIKSMLSGQEEMFAFRRAVSGVRIKSTSFLVYM